jgi:hypothetical protein
MPRARRGDHAAILGAALARVRAGAPDAIAVLDLDSTLLDNRPRQARILEDYGRMHALDALLGADPARLRGWDPAGNLRALGLSEEDVARHLGPFRRFWGEWFFTSAYCRHDVAIPGAPAFARALADAGGRIAYVTGRPARMRDGTLEVFRREGFPLPDDRRVLLLMKPSAETADDAWKAEACAAVDRLGPVAAAFDNEPAHVNGYARAWPDALVVHLDTDHSGRPVEVLERVPSVADFVA